MDDDRPDIGDSGDGEDDDDKERPKRGNLIVLPGGKSIDPDIGADYVVASTGSRGTAIPTVVDPVSVDQEIKERERFVSQQDLVRHAKTGSPTSELVDAALVELTEELGHLKWERRRAMENGKSTSPISLGRIGSLRTLVELLLKRKEASRAEELDLKSPRFQAVFKVWMEFFYDSMEKSGVEPEIIDLVFNQMKADMVGWEKRMDGTEES